MRREATEDGIPTITVEMGEADRFQPILIERGVRGVENLMAEYDMQPESESDSSAFGKVLKHDGDDEWIRANAGGLVDMKWGPHPIVSEGETVCVISDHFAEEEHVVEAPFTGLLIGILANPRVLPGRPLVHLVELTEDEYDAAESAFEEIGFQAQRTFHWMGQTSEEIVEETLDQPEDVAEGEPEDG